MLRYTLRRLLVAVFLVAAVGILGQLAIHMIPGDPAYIILGSETTPDPQVLEKLRQDLGLDRPIHVQALAALWGFARLDLGNSLEDGRAVWKIVADSFPVSAVLVVSATAFAILFGMLLGMLAAVRHNSGVDWGATVFATFGISTPVFVTGTFLIYLFCIYLEWIPASGYVPLSEKPVDFLRRLLLPTVTVGIAQGAEIARMTRSCLLETLRADYITTARSKGVAESMVLFKHALRNAILPVAAMIGLQFGSMFGRTVLVEALFSWPGMMSAMVAAARFHDFPVVRGILVTIAAIFILINLLTDLAYAVLDPRIAYD
ncbi:MAG TPA: ABC transporter permease [Candidatus Methylomirabilis sp.]|nr:ABC transporter permease [Candidatus Methylomirabilis sp.]HSC71142.1 ABC transporter permease [Candidatus Methylomirabilis sp.]